MASWWLIFLFPDRLLVLEARDGVGIRVVGIEDRDELRERQQIDEATTQVRELDVSARSLRRGEAADDLPEARAVHVGHAPEVDDDAIVAGIDKVGDALLELLVALAARDLALELEYLDTLELSLLDLHHDLLRP